MMGQAPPTGMVANGNCAKPYKPHLTNTSSDGAVQYRKRGKGGRFEERQFSVHIIESIPTELFLNRQRQLRAWQNHVSVKEVFVASIACQI